MSKPCRISHRLAAAITAGCASLALANAAGAVDVRSWDQKISDVTKRYIVLASFNNEAVLDKETQLVWQRYWHGTAMQASNAFSFCYSAATGGRYGWRLPTLTEFRSLLDATVTGPLKLRAGHPFRMNDGQSVSASYLFWTSTFDRQSHTVEPQIPRFYTLSLTNANMSPGWNYYERNVVCVRGANTSDEY